MITLEQVVVDLRKRAEDLERKAAKEDQKGPLKRKAHLVEGAHLASEQLRQAAGEIERNME